MKRFSLALFAVLLPFLAMGAANTNILNSAYDRSNGRFQLPTNASFGGLLIGTNKAIATNGLHIRAARTGTDYLRIDDTNGTARLQGGVFPGSPAYWAWWFGDVTPSAANYNFYSNNDLSEFNSASQITFAIGGTARWLINSSGNLVTSIDNNVNIGANLAGSPALIFASTRIITPQLMARADGLFFWEGRSVLSSPGNGNVLLQNNAGTDFSLLQFGGTTAAFPAITKTNVDLAITGADGVVVGSTNKLITPAGIIYPTNSIIPSAAQLGVGGYWVGNSNGNLVTVYSLNGTTTTMKILAP